MGIVEDALGSGVHRNPDAEPGWFTTAYFHHPDEVAGEIADAELVLDRVAGVESPLWVSPGLRDEILADPHRTELLLAMLRRVESEPSLLGASGHLLAIARSAA